MFAGYDFGKHPFYTSTFPVCRNSSLYAISAIVFVNRKGTKAHWQIYHDCAQQWYIARHCIDNFSKLYNKQGPNRVKQRGVTETCTYAVK